ncbi:MAG: YjbH domain-containing protein, partial [Synergistaceae bacterium]|nr:YjbH domain-containing protein [Synergistaceae bacterium]
VFLNLILLSIIITIFAGTSFAITGGNTGLTGLWEYPTAEMPDDGFGRFGYTKATPYGYYFIDLAWLPWMEINARFDTFQSVYTSSGRRYMDKAIDLKFMLWHNKDPEKWYIPSLAGGVVDLMGTELMKAYFGAATWRVGKFAATLGGGSDRLNGFYGGVEWDFDNRLTLKAEYSPLDYKQDVVSGRQVLRYGNEAKRKYNAGVVVKAPWGMEGSVSYQRGNEWVFGISQQLNLGGPYFGHHRKNYGTPGDARIPCWDKIDLNNLISRIKSGIEKYVRVRDVDVKIEEAGNAHNLYLAYENYGYSSHAEAMTRVLVLLAAVMPDVDELTLIHKNAGIPVVRASFPGTLLFDIRSKTLRGDDPMKNAIFNWVSSDDVIQDPDAEGLLSNKAVHELKGMIVFEPRLDQTLREAYMDRWDIDLVYNGRYYNGWSSVFDVRFPIHNHVDTSNYWGLWWEKDLNDEVRIQKAGFMYANKIFDSDRAWFFADAGYLNENWVGANAWARYYGKDGSWWIGARLATFHDRDPYSFGGLTRGVYMFYRGRPYDVAADREWYMTGWLQAGYHFTDFDIDVNLSYGQYIDKDKGFKYEVIRHWDDTAVGFWAIDADRHAPDRDFTLAGFHLEIPAEKWFGTLFGNSSSHIWEQDTNILSSWYMHSGREGATIRTPERVMNQLRPVSMKRNVEKLLRDYCSYEDGPSEVSDTQTSLLEYIFH